MKSPNTLLLRCAAAAVLACAPSGAHAATVLFNFGATSYSGTEAPGHVDGGITGTTWNTVATDTASGIVDANGAATSISLDFGTSIGTSTTADYGVATKSADYTSDLSVTAPLFNTSLGKSNAVRDSGGGISLNIAGLAPGTYTYYVTSFRGDSAGNLSREYSLYGGAGADPVTDFSTLSLGTITNANKAAWTSGNNYITGSFTIDGTNDNFSLLSTSDGFIGVLTSLEITSVPEPSVLMVSALGTLALLRRRR